MGMFDNQEKELDSFDPKAPFIARIFSTMIDVGLWLFIGSEITRLIRFLLGDISYLPILIIIFAFLVYYLLLERKLGYTPGKWLVGLKMVSIRSETSDNSTPSKNQLLARTLARLLGPIGFLTWKRVSIIDLLSGIRVHSSYKIEQHNRLLMKKASSKAASQTNTKKVEKSGQRGGWR